MLKLFKRVGGALRYWEAWDDPDGKSAIIHWGVVGQRGEDKVVKPSAVASVRTQVQTEINKLEGYAEISEDAYRTLLIEYAVDGSHAKKDLEKRKALEDRMQETLGRTGLGHCDGGSIGGGTMEVCCLVVDFETAKRVIQTDLQGTVFQDYTRIYDEDAD